MQILSWNSCGLGLARKKRTVSKLIRDFDIEVCFLFETKLQSYSDRLVFQLWSVNNVSWFGNEAEGTKGGILAMWDNSKFAVSSVEYGHGWIGLFGQNVLTGFSGAVVGVYAPCNQADRLLLWKDLRILKAAFECPWFLAGDFNETMLRSDRSSGFINKVGSTAFRLFIDDCNLIEYNMSEGLYTWFRGGSMSKLDRIFSSPCCHLQFPLLSLRRLPRGFSDHCPLILGVSPAEKGWIPFKFMDCWLHHPNFKDIVKGIWDEACNEFSG
jgi:exonuclease III